MNQAKSPIAEELKAFAHEIRGTSKRMGERLELMGDVPGKGLQKLKSLRHLPKHLQRVMELFEASPSKEVEESLKRIEEIGDDCAEGLQEMFRLEQLTPGIKEMLSYLLENIPDKIDEIAKKLIQKDGGR